MRTRGALAIGALATAAAAAVLVTPGPTLAALNDVVTVEIGVTAWRPAPPTPSTAGAATDPAADLLSPPVPAPEAGTATEEKVSPPAGTTPDVQQTAQPEAESGGPADDTAAVSPGSGSTVVPDTDTTADPAEEGASATGTEGADTSTGAAPTNPDPTSHG